MILALSSFLASFSWAGPESMTIEQKVGQILFVGVPGKDLGSNVSDHLKRIRPGGILLFGHNIRSAMQVSRMNASLSALGHSVSGFPPLLAVDQEGGPVVRIRTSRPLPSALALGLTRDPQLAERAGVETGRLLRALGFNMNLAPVLDLGGEQARGFIGVRAYSIHPEVVSLMGERFAKGLLTSQICPTAKHFPGHGGTDGDSHSAQVRRQTSLDQMLRRDLLPFRNFAREPRSAIMLAHVAFPNIDPSALPATYSPRIVRGLLRDDLQYAGIAVSDDIQMSGASITSDPGERAVRAFEAGVDMVMVAWSPQQQRAAYDGLMAAVKSGRISEDRLDASLKRILAVKREFASRPYVPTSPTLIAHSLNDPSLIEIADVIAWKAFQLVAPRLRQVIGLHQKHHPQLHEVRVFAHRATHAHVFRCEGCQVRLSVDRLERDRLERYLNSNPDSIGIVYVTGRRSAQLVASLPQEIQHRLVVLYTDSGPTAPPAEKPLGEFLLGGTHPQHFHWLLKEINRRSDALAASPGDTP